MRSVKILTALVLSAILPFCACGQTTGGDENVFTPLYPQKENVIADGQSYTGGEIRFPDSLWQTPVSERAEKYDRPDCGADGYFIRSVNYNGMPTDVFVYVGLPEGASADAPVPGMVLVHGGGGTAFPDWVKTWTEKGYAAIAVDTEGHVPTADANVLSGTVTEESPKYHGPANPQFSDCNLPVESQWCYHAVSAVIAANSFLSSFAEVDGAKIGLTGISWGSVVAANAACYDDRFAFCVPVYGGLGMTGTNGICGEIFDRYPRGGALWSATDPLSACRTPMLFVNWNQDPYFTIDATSKCAEAAPYGEMLLIDNLLHGHLQGIQIKEIYVYADSVLQRERIVIPQITQQPDFGNPLLKFDGGRSEIVYATLYTTTDAEITPGTVWQSSVLIPENDTFTLDLSSEVSAFYVTLYDVYEVKATTPVVTR